MTLFDYLLETYGYNEPIITNEIRFERYSKPWIYKELNRLCDNEKLIRFEKGVYYIPKDTPLGKSTLNPRKVIEKKYIRSGDDVFGYYAGQFFMNRIGLSNQMSNLIEIYTNNEASKVRDITVGSQQIRLRRTRTEVTKQNAAVLSFLEMMNVMSGDLFDEEKREIIRQYIIKNGIDRKAISQYAPFFPDKTMRMLIESEAIYDVAP